MARAGSSRYVRAISGRSAAVASTISAGRAQPPRTAVRADIDFQRAKIVADRRAAGRLARVSDMTFHAPLLGQRVDIAVLAVGQLEQIGLRHRPIRHRHGAIRTNRSVVPVSRSTTSIIASSWMRARFPCGMLCRACGRGSGRKGKSQVMNERWKSQAWSRRPAGCEHWCSRHRPTLGVSGTTSAPPSNNDPAPA